MLDKHNKQKLILVAHDVGGVGGMERHLEEMVYRLREDYSLTVISASLRISDRRGIRHIRIPVLHRPFPAMALIFATLASASVRLLSKNAIVHTTGAIVFCKADISTIHFCHAGWHRNVVDGQRSHRQSLLHCINQKVSTHLKLWMEHFCYRPSRTTKLVAVSRRVRKELEAFYPYQGQDISVISNGVDVQRFFPATDEDKKMLRRGVGLPSTGTYLIFSGGDWERKGVRYLLESFNELASVHNDLHVLIVGTGDSTSFGRYIEEHHRDRAHFVGKQSNPEVFYRLSDIFVFPSNYEACSLAVLEAAASGLAMIVTNVGGAADIVEDGVSGYFILRDVNRIAERVQYLLEHPQSRRQMGMAARRRVEHQTWGNAYEEFRKLYINRSQAETDA